MGKSIHFHGQVVIMMAVYTFILVLTHDEQLTEINLIKKFNVLTVGCL
jgi:hypothetical protein